MNKSFFLSGILMIIFYSSMAQFQPTGALTIFSEDGDKFFLILNGERQNNAAQTNLRVEDLTQPYYNAKIIFEDKSLPEISKNSLMISDADGVLNDVTYKIKKDKNGKANLRYFSAVPMQPGFVPPSNVFVTRFGNPAPAAVVATTPATTQVTQTTTTTTTTGVGNTAAVNVNVGGMGVGISVTDPLMSGTVQTTTTQTTTTTGAAMVEHRTPAPAARPRGCRGITGMTAADFSSALATIKKQGFDETRLSTAKQIAGGNCLTAVQVADICKEFSFEETKLNFAKFAYDRCTEPNNFFKVNNVFSFSSSVDDLNEYIQGRQ